MKHDSATATPTELLEDIQFCNDELKTFVKNLTAVHSKARKPFEELTTRQKSRRLSQMRTLVEVSEWLAKTLGLDISGFTVTPTGVESNPIELVPTDRGSTTSTGKQELTESILYLLDKYCVSDSFYHELTMLDDHLPRSHLIKQTRKNLRDLHTITPTPNNVPGARMCFTELLRDRVAHFLKEHPEKKGETIKIKICGDGAKTSRVANYISLSFSIVDDCASTMAAKGIHAIAIINGAEDYDNMAAGFETTFKEINESVEQGSIMIEESKVGLEFYAGADMKFLLNIYGLSNATSMYACIYCKVPKTERWNTTKPLSYYNSCPQKRTVEELTSTYTKNEYNAVRKPLLKIPLDHVVIDELHLLLRVTDVLLRNIVDECTQWDGVEDIAKMVKDPSRNKHINDLVKSINDCGVTFKVWQDEDGKKGCSHIFTSLVGSDKNKVLQTLPERLPDILMPDTATKVAQIWKDFRTLYSTISLSSTTQKDALPIFELAKSWLHLFLSLSHQRTGYAKKNVTPYMHILVYHVPESIRQFGSIKVFTGQGLEKSMDVTRRIYMRKVNRWDAPADILRTQNRLHALQGRERTPRSYTKKDSEYWTTLKRPRLTPLSEVQNT